ncbi:hypothetical protein GGR51DRAFT_311069 [Nemania sp. FL0031]|nr:hypothetical protein GGR51DRAFT_311069 [Nemania sp. FL0031]
MANLPAQHPHLAIHLTDRALTPLITSARAPSQLDFLTTLSHTALSAHESAQRLGLGVPQRIMVEHGDGPVLLQTFLNPHTTPPTTSTPSLHDEESVTPSGGGDAPPGSRSTSATNGNGGASTHPHPPPSQSHSHPQQHQGALALAAESRGAASAAATTATTTTTVTTATSTTTPTSTSTYLRGGAAPAPSHVHSHERFDMHGGAGAGVGGVSTSSGYPLFFPSDLEDPADEAADADADPEAPPMLVGLVIGARADETLEARRAAAKLELLGREIQGQWAADAQQQQQGQSQSRSPTPRGRGRAEERQGDAGVD